jgi:hypothetical protein
LFNRFNTPAEAASQAEQCTGESRKKSTGGAYNVNLHWSLVMNTTRLSICVLVLCSFCSVAWPQYHGPIGSGQGKKRWAEPPEQRNVVQLRNTPDPRELKSDADELARLSQSVPAEIEDVSRGLVSKDLSEKLKRIEKLSKKLRDAVQRSSR